MEEKPKEEDVESEEEKKRPVLRYYPMFHISQVDSVESLEAPVRYDHDSIMAAEEVLTGYIQREGIKLEDGSFDEAYYSPVQDLIRAPSLWQYPVPVEYYSTLAHEAVHSA